MLSKITEKFRSFLSSNSSETTRTGRKRSIDELDDIKSPEKRPRPNIEEDGGEPNTSSIGGVAGWVKRKQRSFRENYYVRQVVNSPKILMRKISSLGQPEELDGGRFDSRPFIQPGVRMEQGPDMHFGTDIISSMPGMQVHSTPMNNPQKGYNFKDAHFELEQPDMFSFQGSPIDKYQFQAPNALPPRLQDQTHGAAQPLARPPIRSHYPSNPGTMSQAAPVSKGSEYVSVYDKTFSRPGRPRRHFNGPRHRHKLGVKESIRMDERKHYAELLQQFTNAPIAGTAFGSSYIKKPSNIFHHHKNEETVIGTQVTNVGPDRISGKMKNPELEKIQVHAKNAQVVTGKENNIPDITARSFVHIQQIQNMWAKNRCRSPVTIDLTESNENSNHASTASDRGTSRSESPILITQAALPKPRPKSPSAISLNKSLQDSKYVKGNWFQDFNSKFSSESRRLEREAQEEEIKTKVFKEKREDWDKDLEKRIRDRLRLSERERGVVEEPYEDDEDKEPEFDEFPDLSEEQDEMVDALLVPHPRDQKVVEGFRLELTRSDLQTLNGLNWLNDEVINFYMNLLMERGTLDNQPSVHAFNTFFYPKIIKTGQQSVRRWTKKVDIFSMDYVLVPVHLGMHWCLAVIDFRKKQICYYDSMGGTNNACLQALRQYLMDESMEKKKQKYDMSDWKLVNMKDIPQQMNGSDCGMFACKFAEYVTRNAPITFTQEHMPYFRRRMIYEIVTKELM